ncbi:MAG TPA: class I SAM-dependent methyltransferase [Pyrinomonadaceae bacterium]|jgi:ubiquinone/menaquinone biosynthesis C-methylase UbiE|nr:class I SAM-dependent methyltransferase [Pyrinomonadaceae bacterium]
MDYDTTDIPVVYDRGRDHGPEVLQLWMNIVSSYVENQRINTVLDLGCGTGRFSEALAVHFDAEVVGIDPSKKMLEQARAKLRDRRVRYELGSGEAIPLPDNCVDLIFMSMIFHHLDNPTLAARECRRVLRDGATAFLRAGTRERISSYPYVDFFPGSRSILEECLPASASIPEVFESAGFSTVASDIIIQEIAPNYAAYAEKLSAGADSVLARLSRSDFEAGIKAMRSHAARVGERAVCEPIDIFVFAGNRPLPGTTTH